MKGKYATRTELTKKVVGFINRDVGVFAFFLFLAFIFWYLNSLGKDAETGIKYQVKYINLPKEKVIEADHSDMIGLVLKGRGSSLLKLKLSGKKLPVTIDISKVIYKRVPGSKTPDYFVVTSGLAKSVASQIGSGLEVVSIKPDTLFFTLVKSALKTDPSATQNQADREMRNNPVISK